MGRQIFSIFSRFDSKWDRGVCKTDPWDFCLVSASVAVTEEARLGLEHQQELVTLLRMELWLLLEGTNTEAHV